MPIRLILADDHPLILDALDTLFMLEEDIEVVERCLNGIDTMKKVREHRPDILILDIRMPGKDGLQVAWEIKTEKLPTKVVLLTAELDEDQLRDAIRMGVQGIILKEMASKLLLQAIRKVNAGEQWIERRMERQLLEKTLRREAGTREVSSVLTTREIDIVKMVAHGLRNKEVAQKLSISEGTVKVHLHNIFEKLKLDGRLALLRYAQEKELA
jgi:DNA-binding NarL/FixJ family response regulator